MKRRFYSFTFFNPNPFGHGGEKRTSQISEKLLEKGIILEKIPTGLDPAQISFGYIRKFVTITKYFIKVLKITGWRFHPYKLYRTIRFVSQFKGVIDSTFKEISPILLMETTRMEFSYVIPMFRLRGFKIIAVPHNIESLVPGMRSGVTNKLSPIWLKDEIKLLKECDKVFAISKEETLLLMQHGVDANYFPYYPTQENLKYLLKIRRERENSNKDKLKIKRILMLGSAINKPTKEGMINRIHFFSENDALINYNLSIAGYGTGDLRQPVKNQDKIKILGELSNMELFNVLTKTDIILIHQPATSGALTRIIEMLIAGIPVLANFESGRNYFGTEGLYVYYNDKQLMNLLERGNFPAPKMPKEPIDEINQFQQYISSIE